ncbi:hypothetical protein [Modicisalibacter coralii]|uniref:hypothetical protein n=1 Tax=Modicisalibacter coralii TaxID=2304602 RepID=UPI00100B8FB3|nr:hypothetical protein [Halomonas coralii]
MKLPTHIRFEIAAINDLCIDIGLAGKYEARADLVTGPKLFVLDVTTCPVGSARTADDCERHSCTLGRLTVPGWGNLTPERALELVREELAETIQHLERLRAETQEGQPS